MWPKIFENRQSQRVFQLTLSALLIAATHAQSNDPGGVNNLPAGNIGSENDPNTSGTVAGNSGSDSGAMYLSKGATIAISVVVGVVVILGITTAVLFYLTKKRQWNMRASIVHSAKRVGSAIRNVTSPRTPHKMTFSPVQKKSNGSDQFVLLNKNSKSDGSNKSTQNRDRDLEKGKVETTMVETGERNVKKQKRGPPPKMAITQSSFDMESPKTPLWSKVFGR